MPAAPARHGHGHAVGEPDPQGHAQPQANHAEMCTTILDASPKFGTSSVEPAMVFCHTDMEAAIRDLEELQSTSPTTASGKSSTRWKSAAWRASASSCRPSWQPMPTLAPRWPARPACTPRRPQTSTCTPCWCAAKTPGGQVALRGDKALDVSYIRPGTKDTADPLGQRGYIGAKTYFTAVMRHLNQGWSAVIECGTPDLA